jgi:F0F1-type ATP synthase alpha subunit
MAYASMNKFHVRIVIFSSDITIKEGGIVKCTRSIVDIEVVGKINTKHIPHFSLPLAG